MVAFFIMAPQHGFRPAPIQILQCRHQRLLTDVIAAPLVAQLEAPSAAAVERALFILAEADGSRSGDDDDARSAAKGPREGSRGVGIDGMSPRQAAAGDLGRNRLAIRRTSGARQAGVEMIDLLLPAAGDGDQFGDQSGQALTQTLRTYGLNIGGVAGGARQQPAVFVNHNTQGFGAAAIQADNPLCHALFSSMISKRIEIFLPPGGPPQP
ncbi:MAG: hypothetical protein BWY77_00143 [bacterium ADurb.Bin431]|nr:MAG: hypothetical protein BWY77_00143 [bacterium ADurb.Bin431]